MRVAYGDWNPRDLAVCKLDPLRFADFGLSHGQVELETLIGARGKRTHLDSCPRADSDDAAPAFRDQVSGDAAGTVAGQLGIRTVGVDEPNARADLRIGVDDLDAIGADAVVTIADGDGERLQVLGQMAGG